MEDYLHKKITPKECEDFMNGQRCLFSGTTAFKDMIFKMRILYQSWDMVNEYDDEMLDHLYEVLKFFGVKKLGAKSDN